MLSPSAWGCENIFIKFQIFNFPGPPRWLETDFSPWFPSGSFFPSRVQPFRVTAQSQCCFRCSPYPWWVSDSDFGLLCLQCRQQTTKLSRLNASLLANSQKAKAEVTFLGSGLLVDLSSFFIPHYFGGYLVLLRLFYYLI